MRSAERHRAAQRSPRAPATRDRRRRAPAPARRRARRASGTTRASRCRARRAGRRRGSPPTGGSRPPMCRFERGQSTAMQPLRAARSSESASATVRCTSSVPGPSTPSESSQAMGRTPGTATDGSASRSARNSASGPPPSTSQAASAGSSSTWIDAEAPAVARRERAQRRRAAAVGRVRRLARARRVTAATPRLAARGDALVRAPAPRCRRRRHNGAVPPSFEMSTARDGAARRHALGARRARARRWSACASPGGAAPTARGRRRRERARATARGARAR